MAQDAMADARLQAPDAGHVPFYLYPLDGVSMWAMCKHSTGSPKHDHADFAIEQMLRHPWRRSDPTDPTIRLAVLPVPNRSHQPRPMPSERLVRCARRKGGALRLLSWQWRKSKPPARAPPDHCKRFYEPQCGSNAPEADGTANCVGGYGGPERIMPFWPRIHVQLRHVHVPTQSWTYGDAHGGSTGELSDLLGPHGWAVRPAVGLQGPAQAVPLKRIDTQCLHSSRRAPRKSQCFHWRSASLYE